MHKTITTTEARKNFADIVDTVVYGKEPIVLTRRGQEIAALISIEEPEKNIFADEFWQELDL